MDLSNLSEDFYRIKDDHLYFVELSESHNISILHSKRSFTFVVRDMPKSKFSEIRDTLLKMNYMSRNVKNKRMLGIRADLYSLGFDFEKLLAHIKAPSIDQVAIKNEILLILSNRNKEKTMLSREDEVDILSCFFG